MIKATKKSVVDILDNLPENFKVLDVGGASAPFKRANNIIDIVPYEGIVWKQSKGRGEAQFNKDSYTQFDICSRKKWPFSDKQFDFSICSHVLEDIRDPLWACSEIIRVSKAGYIEMPSVLYETSFGVESKNIAGASHHRWLVDLFNDKLRFTFKYSYIHSKVVNKNRVKPDLGNSEMYLKIEWENSFEYWENWLNSGKEIFEYFLNKKLSDKEVWRIFRKVGPKNILIKWLAYIKNTNSIIASWYNKINN